MNSNGNLTLIGPFTQLISLSKLPLKGALRDEELEIIENAGIIYEDDTIVEIDKFDILKSKFSNAITEEHYLTNSSIAFPGFVDAHTHICFAGSRANDFAMRNAGKSYLEIARSGGGIWDTVQKTRQATIEELVSLSSDRLMKQVRNGITTCEIKSGYGLSVKEELKMLQVIDQLKQDSPIDIVSTCLAAHIFPKDYSGTISDYLEEISRGLFPIIKAQNLANRIDAFIEEEAFSKSVIRPYFEQAKSYGFDITVHADQFSCSGSEVAIEHGALSADHLEASGQKEILALANSDIIPMALPGASIGIGCDYTPARKLLDAGASLAIASDWNPGSAPMGDLITQASVLATFEKLSTAEVLAGITFRAAAALNLHDRGRIVKGQKADLTCFEVSDYREVLYHQGQLKPNLVIASGKLVYGPK